ncbi:hypothetical protein [Moorena sp. SIO4G3]|uniref:hypothetical protein n=1 Tax=Moorena sp. SIO4G3 TaxID=2607821 RepID=UPI00142B4679|nr:hypothetical protein [Moorena sp. SIO4G3]NEO76136.1 hypothetical protein [Moorena sp. SIO4G3]
MGVSPKTALHRYFLLPVPCSLFPVPCSLCYIDFVSKHCNEILFHTDNCPTTSVGLPKSILGTCIVYIFAGIIVVNQHHQSWPVLLVSVLKHL